MSCTSKQDIHFQTCRVTTSTNRVQLKCFSWNTKSCSAYFATWGKITSGESPESYFDITPEVILHHVAK